MPNLNSWIEAQLKRGYSKSQIKNHLISGGYPHTVVAEVEKKLTSTALRRRAIAVLLVILAAITSFYFYNAYSGQSILTQRPQFLLFNSFESNLINSTPINAAGNSTFIGRNFNNIPDGWMLRFFTPSEFKWDDDVYRSGKNSIRMNNPGDIMAWKRINLDVIDTIPNKDFILTSWVRSNVLTDGFALIQVDYLNQENESVILRRSLKVTGSNDWRLVRLKFKASTDASDIFIRLILLSIKENQELYERLPNLIINQSAADEKLPIQAVWFDDIRLSQE